MTNKDLISVAMSSELRESLVLVQKQFGYQNRSELMRQALVEFLKNKTEKGDKMPVELPSELRQILEKIAVKKGMTVNDLIINQLEVYCEKRWPELVPIKYPIADKFEDLSDLEKINMFLLSKQMNVPIDKCFEEMKRKRAFMEKCKRAQKLTNEREVTK